jgi:hypothetical protein
VDWVGGIIDGNRERLKATKGYYRFHGVEIRIVVEKGKAVFDRNLGNETIHRTTNRNTLPTARHINPSSAGE